MVFILDDIWNWAVTTHADIMAIADAQRKGETPDPSLLDRLGIDARAAALGVGFGILGLVGTAYLYHRTKAIAAH